MRSQVERLALERRALALGLVLSVAIHAGLFVGLRFGELGGGEGWASGADRGVMWMAGTMRAYDIVIIDATVGANIDVRLPTPPTPSSTPELSSNEASTQSSVERAASRSADAFSVRKRLLPRFSDSRLWTKAARSPASERLRRARARIEDGIDRYVDSIAIAAESERRITDWTYVSADGSRWGATPGRFYIGDLMIPYCGGDYGLWQCGFGVPLGRVDRKSVV